MYTDNFEEEILFTPARKDGEACNHLKIVTAFTDVERISSHLIKLFDGRNKEYVSGIKVDFLQEENAWMYVILKRQTIISTVYYLIR